MGKAKQPPRSEERGGCEKVDCCNDAAALVTERYGGMAMRPRWLCDRHTRAITEAAGRGSIRSALADARMIQRRNSETRPEP